MASIVVRENGKEKTVQIKDDVIAIGREITCTVQIMDDTASRKHVRIERDGPTYLVEDLQTRNGTYLNEVLLQGRKPLRHGDVVRIGQARIEFQESARAVKQAVHFLGSPNVINLILIVVIGAVLGGMGWFVIHTLNDLTAQRGKDAAQPTWVMPENK